MLVVGDDVVDVGVGGEGASLGALEEAREL